MDPGMRSDIKPTFNWGNWAWARCIQRILEFEPFLGVSLPRGLNHGDEKQSQGVK